ncbi:MAG: hydantoinase B/oxoprolinase family protein [Bacteroidota bacterium]
MDTKSPKWQVWIDTGGTFTDCIAKDPTGKWHRQKVLSSAGLRGTLTQQLSPYRFRFTSVWSGTMNLFRGYTLRLLKTEGQVAKIKSMYFAKGILETDRPLDLGETSAFEISGGEEAPILAIRLITQTPLDQPLPPIDMRLGSTKGTNALLEQQGSPLCLLITQGFKDLLAIGTQQRPHLFQLAIPPPQLLYKAVLEVKERIDAEGKIVIALEEEEIKRIVTYCVKQQFPAIAIALLHAYVNPQHENALREALQKAGIKYLSASAMLSPSINILPRARTAVVDAYLSPVMDQYLQGIVSVLKPDPQTEVLDNTGLKVMTSSGGLVDARFFCAKDSLLSGPAGGIVGAARIAQQMGHHRILTLDMGGTSTDTARYDQSFDYNFLTRVGSAELVSPSLAIETVAAGGGSICSFDGNKLCVGPQSAGADPGPACYGAGGPLTITDVNLLLGRLDSSKFSIPIQPDQAVLALQRLKEKILRETGDAYTYLELLLGLEQIANEKMAEAIRKISVAKGFDPRDYALLVFGGAGGLHACAIAELLDVTTIILPFDAGLLSAYGMGHAQIERLVQKQVLTALSVAIPQLPEQLAALKQQVEVALTQEGFSKKELGIKHIYLYLRFIGQTSALEIDIRSLTSFTYSEIKGLFAEKYQGLFGHWPQGQVIELESIKVIAANLQTAKESRKKEYAPFPAEPMKISHPLLGSTEHILVYDWDCQGPGAQIKGPALLLNQQATAYIGEHWQLEIDGDRNALLKKQSSTRQVVASNKKAIELELFTNRFMAIAEEMGAQLQRTAFSVNIKERLDFSCAILDADAELLVNAPHIPVHLGSLGICTRLVRDVIDLGPGDVVITNHPKYGGSHLPDVNLICAVFTTEGERIAYLINRAHHAEIGGSRPGSMPPDAQNLLEEGVVIPPMYLVKGGQVLWPAIETLLKEAPYPSRSVAENIADINAALASLRNGAEALQKMVVHHGLEKVHFYMAELKSAANRALWKSLVPYQNQNFQATEQLDDGHTIQLKIAITENQLTIDFTGTSGVHPFNLNANISIVFSAVIYVLRLLCQEDIPLNEGLMQQVDIKLPNCFLHPHFPEDFEQCPAVVGGNTECSQRLVDTLLKAFGLAACSQGTMNNFLFGNASFGYYETIGGGTGAGPGFDGRSAIHQHMTNTKITDPEELEFRYPVRLQEFAIRTQSGGDGQWRGGDGIIRAMKFLAPVEVTLISQHRKVAPYGRSGGKAGKCGTQRLIRADGTSEALNGVQQISALVGDQIIIETPGGGGFGEQQ